MFSKMDTRWVDTYFGSTIDQSTYDSFYTKNSNFISYTNTKQSSIGHLSGDYSTSDLYLYAVGKNNSEIQLSYVSFAIEIFHDPTINPNHLPWDYNGSAYFYIFGVPTPPNEVPKAGSATYDSMVYGVATLVALERGHGTYDINGTSRISVNFTQGTLNTSLNFSGVWIPGYTDSISLGKLPSMTFNGSGVVGSLPHAVTGSTAGAFYGSFNGPATIGTYNTTASGNFNGRFYGPNAQEIGYTFIVSNGYISATGVAVGKKN